MAQWLITQKEETKTMFGRFNKLYKQIKENVIDKEFLKDIEEKDPIFPEIDYKIYK